LNEYWPLTFKESSIRRRKSYSPYAPI